MKISLIITNFNGLKIIKKSLPVILRNSPEVSEFIFIDDASSDGSVDYVKSIQKKQKKLKIIVNRHNQGFPVTSNTAVNAATGDLVVLLNNDIFPKPGYISSVLKHFDDPSVFGVGFAESGHENYARIFWSEGYLQHEPSFSHKSHITAWISGGSSIVRRQYFQQLGGFDPIYSPFYFEDLDLGFRAWKSGYKLIWEPKSIVIHNHGTTTSKLPRHFVSYVKERNHLLTVLRNITDSSLLGKNKIAQILRILTGPNYIKIILAAKRQLKISKSPIFKPVLSDIEVLDLFK